MSGNDLPILCYWDIRGLAQPIRLLLEYTGTKFVDKKYSCGPPPDFDKSCWANEKNSIGLDFPNLPYYIDGKHKLTQSNAILRHIARKNDLLGKTEDEMVRVDILAEQSMDFRNGLVRLAYNQAFDQLKGEYIAGLSAKLNQFAAFLGDNEWFAGANITFVDFVMYELLDQHRQLAPDVVAANQKLSEFLDRFEALPAINEYMKSDRYMKGPMNNKMAKFGNQ